MRILVVEDDQELSRSITILLKKQNYTVDACYDGDEGLYHAQQDGYDAILLDRMLPGMDGMAVLSALRARGIRTPVLLLTALGAVGDKVEGLDAGADDYLTKPFEAEELLARLRVMLRRAPGLEPERLFSCGDITLNPSQLAVTGPKGACPLSRREYDMLEFLVKHAGRTLSRAQLFAHVWGPSADVNEANLDGYVYFVRRRLAAVGSALQLKTVRGVGLRLETAC